MLSTTLLIASFGGFVVLSVGLWVAFLRIGLRWARVTNVTRGQIAVTTAGSLVAHLMLQVGLCAFPPRSSTAGIMASVVNFAASVLIPCLFIMWQFKASVFRSFQAWLPTILPSVGLVLFALLVWRPFVWQAYFSPTNAMAPTLLGYHVRGECPECGQPSFCSRANSRRLPSDPLQMICLKFHVHEIHDVPNQTFAPDHYLASKFLSPNRWDVIVFQYPEDPSVVYAKRLVGLPGETIQIEDGTVWVNGRRVDPPESLHGIEYVAELPNSTVELWGSKNRPAVLGTDEYFVVGDFSVRSKDSRMWQRGAPGHNPFAVPASHVRGVVTHIYWPPQRWRILR